MGPHVSRLGKAPYVLEYSVPTSLLSPAWSARTVRKDPQPSYAPRLQSLCIKQLSLPYSFSNGLLPLPYLHLRDLYGEIIIMLPSPIAMSGALLKRGAEVDVGHGDGNGNMAQLPGWAVIVLFADFLVFFPIFFYVSLDPAYLYLRIRHPLQPCQTNNCCRSDTLSPAYIPRSPLSKTPYHPPTPPSPSMTRALSPRIPSNRTTQP